MSVAPSADCWPQSAEHLDVERQHVDGHHTRAGPGRRRERRGSRHRRGGEAARRVRTGSGPPDADDGARNAGRRRPPAPEDEACDRARRRRGRAPQNRRAPSAGPGRAGRGPLLAVRLRSVSGGSSGRGSCCIRSHVGHSPRPPTGSSRSRRSRVDSPTAPVRSEPLDSDQASDRSQSCRGEA